MLGVLDWLLSPSPAASGLVLLLLARKHDYGAFNRFPKALPVEREILRRQGSLQGSVHYSNARVHVPLRALGEVRLHVAIVHLGFAQSSVGLLLQVVSLELVLVLESDVVTFKNSLSGSCF